MSDAEFEDGESEFIVPDGDNRLTVPDESPAETPGLWERLRQMLRPSLEEQAEERAGRLRELNIAIELFPNSPSNYVLRGELYLGAGANELAVEDFRRALELATKQVETQRWGVVAQAMQDRVETGLQIALKNLRAD